jgi:hypothetical protein
MTLPVHGLGTGLQYYPSLPIVRTTLGVRVDVLHDWWGTGCAVDKQNLHFPMHKTLSGLAVVVAAVDSVG